MINRGSILFAACAALMLAACGGDDEAAREDAAPAETAPAPETAEAAPEKPAFTTHASAASPPPWGATSNAEHASTVALESGYCNSRINTRQRKRKALKGSTSTRPGHKIL